ncbi:hypothetical protein [Mucilaginibacter gotjawali]|uniref:Uncharacterized protein n=1 Tax=Mucilaginibacter gotjawali TaxID=1550579 RepID=A0A839S9I2_9SPHI|nr:hypothetical protein [Mucilaginibacter gotjawali]MBB3054486.1 hypothetical protein [Mucilaginibacter gotjawali]
MRDFVIARVSNTNAPLLLIIFNLFRINGYAGYYKRPAGYQGKIFNELSFFIFVIFSR